MRHVLDLLVVPLGALALAAAVEQHVVTRDAALSHTLVEQRRLRAHFDAVDAELRARDVTALSPAQRASRATLIAWLREYRHVGSFPHNDRFPDRAVPFFRDSDGVPCAMAYLVERSGRRDIVDRVAATRNNAYIRELLDERALVAWLDSVGLSVTEASRIQPSYDGGSANTDTGIPGWYVTSSIATSGSAIAVTAANGFRPGRVGGVIGLVAGGAAAVSGLAMIHEDRETAALALTNTVIGAVAIIVGANALQRRPSDTNASRRGGARGVVDRMALAPTTTIEQGRPRYGVALRTTF